MIKESRRLVLRATIAMAWAASGSNLRAQSGYASVAVPFYRPTDVAVGLYQHWAPGRVQALVDSTGQLHAALITLHGTQATAARAPLAHARERWLTSLEVWENLATVPLAPLIERRSLRQMDFTPTRPLLIQRAIQGTPSGASAMARIGTPAKGFPALEWLLWAQPVQPGSKASAYAVEVAAELEREAKALQSAFRAQAEREWDETDGDAAFSAFINQWIGALERLRWTQMEKPWREQQTRRSTKDHASGSPAFARALGGATYDSWWRQWRVLRELAVFPGEQGPAPGQGVVSLESYLRGRGLNPLADAWVMQIERSDVSMKKLHRTGSLPGRPAGFELGLAAARALAKTKRLAEAEVAPALEVSIGFSDADGD